MLPDLLAALTPRLDHGRVVKILQGDDHLPLAKPYLVGTQKLNITVVNEAYNDLLIEEEDHVTLRSSLETFDQYDAVKLAKRLENHELLEFRRIAALLYRVSAFAHLELCSWLSRSPRKTRGIKADDVAE